jgi:glutamate-1-semialdehyde 2,1-aminomutase
VRPVAGRLCGVTSIGRERLRTLIDREHAHFGATHGRSRAMHDAAGHLLGRVPMTWMRSWVGGFPIAFVTAQGNRVTDLDGHGYIDFALGDTGAMAGHSPRPTVDAVQRRIETLGGVTTMLPTEDAEWVAAELARRFGVPQWSFTLSATDANRWALRLARLVTGRAKVLVFSYCYHGSVDETFVVCGRDGVPVSRPGNVGPAVDPTETTRVVEWNDLDAVERELRHRDVAAILTEPALTNIGIVLPDVGFHPALRELATRYGALLMIDETHTISAGPGGMTARDGLQPDAVVVGKALGGGIPCGAFGLSAEVADAVNRHAEGGSADIEDVGGIGGTLAGNPLSTAAMRATLEHVLTDVAFDRMISCATRFADGVDAVIERAEMPWSLSRLGARAEYRFARPAPRSGGASAAAGDDDLDEYLHLYTLNRGILITPFHNMALMCPETSAEDVDRHSEVFDAAVSELVG